MSAGERKEANHIHSPFEAQKPACIWAAHVGRLGINLAFAEEVDLRTRRENHGAYGYECAGAHPLAAVELFDCVVDGRLENALAAERFDDLAIPEELGEDTIWRGGSPQFM